MRREMRNILQFWSLSFHRLGSWKLGKMTLCFTISLIFYQNVSAQTAIFSASVDSNDVEIGDWINLQLNVTTDQATQIEFPLLTDTVDQFEIIEQSKIDTINTNSGITYQKTITISAYDSGFYIIKPLTIFFQSGNTIDSAKTEPILITVHTLPVDTAQAFKAIKEPLGVPYTLKEFLPHILIGLAAILIAFIIWYLIKRRKQQPFLKAKPAEPAHIIAVKKLKQLEEENLWQKNEVKLYYIKLSDIIREYIEYNFHKPALESTTDEILDALSRTTISKEALSNLKEILILSDLVKFAKANPLQEEHVTTLQNSYKFIDLTKVKQDKIEESEPLKEEGGHVG